MRRVRSVFLVVALVAGALVANGAYAADTITNGLLTSKAPDHIQIGYTLFKPAAASGTNQVPFIVHSHGWGGSRSTTGFSDWLGAGFGVLSFDQRGWGQSGGKANVEDPELEGFDVESVVDFIASLDWVKHDNNDPNDPVLGAIGGSYGGGYQTIGALSEILHHGATRFNALAPEITWFDLPSSLAPQGVPRSAWTTVLYAAGATHVPDFIHKAQAWGFATGQFPDETTPAPIPNLTKIFYEHSPHWFADHGIKLDIPVLFGQGITDNLFVLNQGWHNLTEVLTPAAQGKSFLIGYNGGHVLPEVVPLSSQPGSAVALGTASDPCSGQTSFGNFAGVSREFFRNIFAGTDYSTLLPARFNLATNSGTGCIHTASLTNWSAYSVQPAGLIATNTTAGAPVSYKLADGPLRVAGIPRLRGTLTAAGVDARAFFGLSVGITAADAKVVQNNVTPLRALLPGVQQPFDIELAGCAVDIPAGQSLFLTVSPFASLFAGTVSRTPGALIIEDATVDVPLA